MGNERAAKVDQFMESLSHARRHEIAEVRDAMLGLDLAVTERVKWNAPSFCIDGDDRVTLRLQPQDRLEVIFHRGSMRRDDVDSFRFDDPTGWIAWATPDRGVVTLVDAADTATRLVDLAALARAWMLATRT